MSSKQKDKSKKSKEKPGKIKLEELASEEISAPGNTVSKQNWKYEVKLITTWNTGQNEKEYEETVSEILNSAGSKGFEVISILPAKDSKKLIAFFKSPI